MFRRDSVVVGTSGEAGLGRAVGEAGLGRAVGEAGLGRAVGGRPGSRLDAS
jgi:hypothetical protein